MTAVVQPITRLDAPVPERLTATLLDTYPATDGRLEPDGLYVSLNCLELPATADLCDPDAIDDNFFTEAVVVDGIRFVTDIGYSCGPGANFEQLAREFARNVDLRESASVEQNVMALRFTGVEGGDAATDLTPAGGAVTPAVGLSLLEGDAARGYVGLPTIHAPRTVASRLVGEPSWTRTGERLFTPLGSKFVAGAGYDSNIGPDGDPPDAGEMWMYATGELRIWRGRPVVKDPVFDYSANVQYVRANRVYVVDVDCYVSAVRVGIEE